MPRRGNDVAPGALRSAAEALQGGRGGARGRGGGRGGLLTALQHVFSTMSPTFQHFRSAHIAIGALRGHAEPQFGLGFAPISPDFQ